MTKPMVRFHNIETDEIIDREMTDEEYLIHQAEVNDFEAKKLAELKEAEDKISAKQALLEKLGITEEEAALLLGGTK